MTQPTVKNASKSADTQAGQTLILAAAARRLAQTLHTAFRGRWEALPGASTPPQPTPEYQAAPVPVDLIGRRAELIVEASDLAALNNALSSDADALVIDFDDTFTPTLANVQAAYDALPRAAASDKPLLARPRAFYAVEQHLDFGGPAIAAFTDLAVILAARPEQPIHIYVPKLETVAEAQLWDDALSLAERELGLAPNTIKVCIQIETFLAVQHADALLYALRGRAFGLNAGRWDYVFSLIKAVGSQRGAVPPRSDLTMDVDAMRAYAEALLRVAQRRGAQAIGGSAAVAPDAANPQPALDLVQADKRREAQQGFTAAWAGLPMLLGDVRAGFDGEAPAPLSAEPVEHTLKRLLDLPAPQPLPLDVLQDTIGLALDVFEAWYAGQGVVVRNGRIEDTATAELARAQVWQWVSCAAQLSSDAFLTPDRYRTERRALRADDTPEAQLLDALVLAETCPAYFPRFAQQLAAREPLPTQEMPV
ncbi:malate synthase A [Deinococcus detaillensis]|uniref:malate synthase n=1 Tax=Deinococcus detaillensis TaxID=2592048 RepID=A0A553V4W8_9DEIO|nr:aldolase/citrate lyase family protein [Deinococcus detaillensis]TSA87509.1 malate synthase A [Deinococcus detaillensis]